MKQIELEIEIESPRDLASVSLLVGCPCDPERSVQQGQIDLVKRTAASFSRWKIVREVEVGGLDDGVRALIQRMTKWPQLPSTLRSELRAALHIMVYHDLACCSVGISAASAQILGENDIGLAVVMMATSDD